MVHQKSYGNSLPRFLRTRSRTGKAWCIKRATKHPAFPWRRRNLGHLRPASTGAEARRTLQTTAGAHAMRASAAEPPMCRGNAHNKTRHSDLAGRSHGTRVRSHTFDRPTPNPSFGQGGPVPSQRTGQHPCAVPVPTHPAGPESQSHPKGQDKAPQVALSQPNQTQTDPWSLPPRLLRLPRRSRRT